MKLDAVLETVPVGKGLRLRDGHDVTIAAIGNRVAPALASGVVAGPTSWG